MTELQNIDLRTSLILTPGMKSMIVKLKERMGIKSTTEILRHALVMYYESKFKDYVEVQKDRSKKGPMTPEVRAERDVIREEERVAVRKKRIYDRGLALCKLLEGEIEGPRGSESCRFKNYSMMNPNYAMQGEMVVPFDLLNDDTIEKQYDGGGIINDLPLAERKEKILKVLK